MFFNNCQKKHLKELKMAKRQMRSGREVSEGMGLETTVLNYKPFSTT